MNATQVRKYIEEKSVGLATLISQCLQGHFLRSDSVSIRILPLPILHAAPHPQLPSGLIPFQAHSSFYQVPESIPSGVF